MRLKVRLLSLCTRHKCTSVEKDNIPQVSGRNRWKRVRIIDQNPKPINSNLKNLTYENNSTATNSTYNTPKIPENFEAGFYSFPKKSKNVLNKVNSIQTDKTVNLNVGLSQNDAKVNTSVQTTRSLHRQLSQNNNAQQSKESKDSKDSNLNLKEDSTRINEVNMQMLSKLLHEQIFGKDNGPKQFSEEEIDRIRKNLNSFGINVENATRLPDVDLKLPALEGKDIEEHFYNIARTYINPYIRIINTIVNDIPEMPKQWLLKEGWTRYTADGGAESVDYPLEDGMIFDVEVCVKQGPLPTLATAVSNKAWYGWVSNSLAQGAGQTFDTQMFIPSMLVPIESSGKEHGQKLNQHQKRPKIIVGHNVSYDRSRIKEQYWLNCTGTRFLDTMSLHVCVSCPSRDQRSLLMSKKTDCEKELWQSGTSLNSLTEVHKLYCGQEIAKEPRGIFVEGTIEDVKSNFNMLMSYCASDAIATHNILRKLFPIFQERFPHPVTLAGMLELGSAYLPVNSNWQRYLEESEATFDDLNYEAKFTLARRADSVCQLMHNEKYKEDLWMWDQDWSTQQIKMKSKPSPSRTKSTDSVADAEKESSASASDDKKRPSDREEEEEEEEDLLAKEFSYLEETRHLLPARMPHMPGYPVWYRQLCPKRSDKDWAPGPQNISTSMRVVPKLLNLTWEKYPLHHVRTHGWGILVPRDDVDPDVETNVPLKALLAHCRSLSMTSDRMSRRDTSGDAMSTLSTDVQMDLHKTEFWRHKKQKRKGEPNSTVYNGTAVWCKDIDIDGCCYFFKLPHKDGPGRNVGNPLAKDFINKFSENGLASSDASASEVLKITRMLSYWRNNRDRIMSQLVVWLDERSLPGHVKRLKRQTTHYGAIVPQVVVSGTLTRRAVEPTWMTASNAHAERVGSELRCMVQAPPGYNIVGADVDSQELWIASVIGDAHYTGRVHGATPFGWMTLIGTKSNGTDMHSVTAKAVGISRDHAKVINYARIYGAGQKFAKQLLKQFNPSMTDAEATAKSRKMFALTKGKEVFRLKKEYVTEDLEDKSYASFESYQVAKVHGKALSDMFHKREWVGGSESAMFNRLEEIAGNEHPVTPFLNARLSRPLEPANTNNDDKHLPTKVNWVVQSGAVDFLHLMLVCMRWLMRDNARFCLSFHDEVRYLVPSRYKYNAALAMHATNLLTRSFCVSRLGMRDLPMSVAFFASVEVDTILRKESTHDCKTPSNSRGLQNGYEIPLGESLDVWTALEKSDGSLGWWNDARVRRVKPADSVVE